MAAVQIAQRAGRRGVRHRRLAGQAGRCCGRLGRRARVRLALARPSPTTCWPPRTARGVDVVLNSLTGELIARRRCGRWPRAAGSSRSASATSGPPSRWPPLRPDVRYHVFDLGERGPRRPGARRRRCSTSCAAGAGRRQRCARCPCGRSTSRTSPTPSATWPRPATSARSCSVRRRRRRRPRSAGPRRTPPTGSPAASARSAPHRAVAGRAGRPPPRARPAAHAPTDDVARSSSTLRARRRRRARSASPTSADAAAMARGARRDRRRRCRRCGASSTPPASSTTACCVQQTLGALAGGAAGQGRRRLASSTRLTRRPAARPLRPRARRPASLLGPPGQGAYAAANAELDALAWARRGAGSAGAERRLGPVGRRSAWRRGSATRAPTAGAERGLGWIAADDGFAALERLLRDGATAAAVLPIDWTRFLDPAARRRRPRRSSRPSRRPADGRADRPAGPAAADVDVVDGWRAAPRRRPRRARRSAYVAGRARHVLGADDDVAVDERASRSRSSGSTR